MNLLYPAYCQACSKKTDVPGQYICQVCLRKIKERLPPFCIKCGRQLNGEPELTSACSDCRNNPPHFDRAWSACYYEGILKDLVHNFKYKKMTCLKNEFAGLMTGFMKRHGAGIGSEIIMPVPMHPKRLFAREVDHSDILAKNIAKEFCVPYSNRALKKIKDTALQARLRRPERIKNLAHSFGLVNRRLVENKHILLVDDLFTTGTTVNECARVLKRSGAKFVEVITLARGDMLS